MARLQRLALSTTAVMLLLVLLGGLLRAIGNDVACNGLWPRCTDAWWPSLALEPVAGYLSGLLVVVALGLAIITAIWTRGATGTSRRTRIIAWSVAGVLAGERAVHQTVLSLGVPDGWLAAGHAILMAVLGGCLLLCWSIADDGGGPVWLAMAGRDRRTSLDRPLVWLTWLSAAGIVVVIASGALTASGVDALPCPSWPLCVDGGLVPDQPTVATWLHLGHRILAAAVAVAVIAVVVRAWTTPSSMLVRRLSLAAAAFLIVQVLLGGNFVVSGGAVWLGLLHVVAGTALWLAVVALAIVAPLPPREVASHSSLIASGQETVSGPAGARMAVSPTADGTMAIAPGSAPFDLSLPDLGAMRAVVADYVALTKPGILTLLLVTTFAAMLIAAAGLPAFALVCVAIVGGALAAGGANVLNCYIDRDIDAQMTRTRHRATAANRIPLPHVLGFGVGLTALAIVLLGIGANWVAAGLALAGNLYYVLVYTKWLKRRTPQNIVIGGAAGAVPPLVGWAAVTGDLSVMAWLLFAIIFMWTPPHFWALALLKQGEYGRAAVPMLPVVAGEAETRRQIVIYSVLLFAVCLVLVPLGLGPIYLVAALVINAIFLGLALVLYWRPSKRHARRLFFWSLWYLVLIFLAAVVDRLILG